MATRAEIIDAYFKAKNYYPHVPYAPIGETIVQEVEGMGPDGLYLSTACALIEKESGGKTLFGCDTGRTQVAPYCQQAVTGVRVLKLLELVNMGGPSNGVGLTQLTYPPFIREAQNLGGAQFPRYQMRVGFRVLNDFIASLGWPAGAAAYNAGPSNWQAVIDTYGADMARLEREWDARLGGSVPKEPKEVVLRRGLGKDGFGPYVDAHPTDYDFRPDVDEWVHKLVNMPEFRNKIWITTYWHHPPGRAQDTWRWRDRTSFDVWGWGGRGVALPVDIGKRVFDVIFNEPNPPDIWWTIYRNQIWTRGVGWGAAPPGPPGSDAQHLHHIHVTVEDA